MGRNVMDIEDVESDAEPLDMMTPNVTYTEEAVQGLTRSGLFEFDKNGKSIELEKFMQEGVVVELHTSTDPNAAPVVFVGCNGDTRWLPRGVPIKIPRKFVERLAQVKEARFKTTENPDRSADNSMQTKRTQASPYGFSVIRDPNPKGRAWLEAVRRQPT